MKMLKFSISSAWEGREKSGLDEVRWHIEFAMLWKPNGGKTHFLWYTVKKSISQFGRIYFISL